MHEFKWNKHLVAYLCTTRATDRPKREGKKHINCDDQKSESNNVNIPYCRKYLWKWSRDLLHRRHVDGHENSGNFTWQQQHIYKTKINKTKMNTVFFGLLDWACDPYRYSHLAFLQIVIKLFVLHVFLHLSLNEYPPNINDFIHC